MFQKVRNIYNSIKLDLFDCFTYFLFLFFTHRLTYSVVTVSTTILRNNLNMNLAMRYIVIYSLYAIVPHLFFLIIAYRVAEKQYKPSDDPYLWLKTGLFYTIPAELIRLCICSTTVDAGRDLPWKFGMEFATVCHLAFRDTYGNWSGRSYEVSTMNSINEIEYIAADYLAYITYHIIYLILYLTVTMSIYYFMWKEVKKERELMHDISHKAG